MTAEIVAVLEEKFPAGLRPLGWRAYRLLAHMNDEQRRSFLDEMTEYWRELGTEQEVVDRTEEVQNIIAEFRAFEKQHKRKVTEEELDALILTKTGN